MTYMVGREDTTNLLNSKDGDETVKEKQQYTDKRDKVVSERMSYWIKIIKVIFCIQVLISHQSYRVLEDYGVKRFSERVPRSWLQVLTPHILTTYSTACVQMFFAFAGFFQMVHFERLNEEYRHDTRGFVKAFFMQWAKRYFRIRSILLVQGLGYASFLYVVFGSNGRDVYYDGPRTLRYWIDVLSPFYQPKRIMVTSSQISMSAWFQLSLLNVEFIYYLMFFVTYFIRKRVPANFYYAAAQLIILTALFTTITVVLFEKDMFFDSNLYYLAGLYMYWCRYFLVTNQKLSKYVNWLYQDTQRQKVYCYVFTAACVYGWLVVSRLCFEACMPFLIIPLILDSFAYPRFPEPYKSIIDYTSKVQMQVYVVHHPFLYEAMPPYFPQLLPDDLEKGITAIRVNWFVSWLLLLQFLMLAAPLYYMCQFLEQFPDFVAQLVGKKRINWRAKGEEIAWFAIWLVLVVLTQTGTFGRQKYDVLPRAWINYQPGYDPRWQED